jgi:hypothetical protein
LAEKESNHYAGRAQALTYHRSTEISDLSHQTDSQMKVIDDHLFIDRVVEISELIHQRPIIIVHIPLKEENSTSTKNSSKG